MTMQTTPVISIHDLRHQWPGAAHPLLTIEHWSISPGERVFIYGHSGTGKSTLLNILAGILPIQHGSVEILGQNLAEMCNRARDRFRAQRMGVIFQQFNLLPYLSVWQNIQLGQHFSSATFERERVLFLLSALGLDGLCPNQAASQLSVGQQQRVAVARALYHQPDIIVADEPTSALDEETRNDFIRLLLEQVATKQSTVLFVSHDKSLAHHFDQWVDLAAFNTGLAPL